MDIEKLSNALHYLSVNELIDLCKKFHLPTHVPAPLLKKPSLIKALLTYVERGEIIVFKHLLPQVSCAKTQIDDISANTKILFGSYKNDLKTRLFMQSLVGPHFHFTAYGQDWIKERWMQGNPPTYQEFADFWQKENLYRKEHKNTPLKQEWAYLNFLREYKKENPHATKNQTLKAWEQKRKEKVDEAYEILSRIFNISMR